MLTAPPRIQRSGWHDEELSLIEVQGIDGPLVQVLEKCEHIDVRLPLRRLALAVGLRNP